MKKYLILLLFAYNISLLAKKITKENYKVLYGKLFVTKELPSHDEKAFLRYFSAYRLKRKMQLHNIAEKYIADLESRTSSKSIFGRMFGGGALAGIAGFAGVYSWTKSGMQLFNKFSPFTLDTSQGTLLRNFVTGTSAVLAGIGGYYAFQGFYDWANRGNNDDELKNHRKIKKATKIKKN